MSCYQCSYFDSYFSLFTLEGETGSWIDETTINFALQTTVGALAGTILSCPVTGAICAGGYSLLKSSCLGFEEVAHVIRLEYAKTKEDSPLQHTANKITGIITSILLIPFIPLLIPIHLILTIGLTNIRLIHDNATAWLSMGVVYTGAVATAAISPPTAILLALVSSCTDLFQNTITAESRVNRIFAQSFNEVAQALYPYPLNRILTCIY